MRAVRVNHASIAVTDVEESARFYEDLFSMERVPSPNFGIPVIWLRVGEMQLHLFQGEPAPTGHHIGMTIDDFDAIYEALKARASDSTKLRLVELPSRQVQLYFRDPSDNLIELNWPDADLLDRSRYPELRRLADEHPQGPDTDGAVLFL